MEIDNSIKVGDIVATNASNTHPFVGQRVFGKVKEINFKHSHRAFQVDVLLNTRIFHNQTHVIAYPYDAPGRPYEDAYLVKATPEECEAHKTGVMPDKEFKYKKGIWYMHENGSSFRKCNRDSNNRIFYAEHIIKKQYEVHSGKAHWDGIEADMNEVSKYLPDGHPDKIVEPVNDELQIGKWYRVDHRYLKLKSIEDCGSYRMLHGETIHDDRYLAEDYWANSYFENTIKKDGPLKDLSEIQEYLPDGHIDKIEEKKLEVSEAFHDFQIGQKFIILGDRPAAGLKKGDIVTCFYVSKDSIDVIKDGVSGNPIKWSLSKSTIGEYYEPYYGGGGIVEQIEGSKKKNDSPFEKFEYSFGFIDQSQYRSGYDPVEEPKSVISKNDTFDPIVKAPIVI